MAPAHSTGLGGGRSCCVPWKHPTSSSKFTPALARPLTCRGPTSSGKALHLGRSSREPLGPASPWSSAPRGLLSPTLPTGAEWSHQSPSPFPSMAMPPSPLRPGAPQRQGQCFSLSRKAPWDRVCPSLPPHSAKPWATGTKGSETPSLLGATPLCQALNLPVCPLASPQI